MFASGQAVQQKAQLDGATVSEQGCSNAKGDIYLQALIEFVMKIPICCIRMNCIILLLITG